MKNKSEKNIISSEKIAAFIDGNTTAAENKEILDALFHDNELREILSISQKVDSDMSILDEKVDFIPMTALAAECEENSFCCLECEKYVLNKRKIGFDENELLDKAIKNKWQKEKGTALYNVGRHLEEAGLIVSRQYNCNICDIVEALNNGDDIIVAVDSSELKNYSLNEIYEDLYEGHNPDHTVVVLSCDMVKELVAVYDPNTENEKDIYPLSQFMDAWNDSKNYLVKITSDAINNYKPNPVDLSDVVLTEDLNELREAIAENAHEIWAENRQREGWSYGPQRNDLLKQTPDMVPYSQLPESEKKYDREMAMQTIKLLKKLGYDLIKREDTELYKVLKLRMQNAGDEFYCKRCGNVIYRHQAFCDRCGLKLNIDYK